MQITHPRKKKRQWFKSTRGGCLGLTRALAVAADNLDLVGAHGGLVVELESHIFDQEGPDLVAESVGIQMALTEKKKRSVSLVQK